MPFRNVEQGINAIRAGNLEEGARLLRIALKDPEVTGKMRAVALTWLAETSNDNNFKMDCYREAHTADPSNEDVNQRIAYLLSLPLPSTPPMPPNVPAQSVPTMPTPTLTPLPPTMPNAPAYGQVAQNTPPHGMSPTTGMTPLPSQTAQTPAAYGAGNAFFRTVGIQDGPNGPGTAFFVRQNGLLATSRSVIGGMETVTVALDTGRHVSGRVVRAFPEFDTALVQIELAVSNLLPISPMPTIPDEARLTAIAHNGKVIGGQKRATKRQLASHWFPTTINALADAGGNPVFDERNYLVGMLTKNASRSSGYLYGLHIAALLKCVETYVQEMTMDPQRVYCPCCGYVSRAAAVGAFYCEVCGGVLPPAVQSTRFPFPQAAAFYGENMHQPCRHCGARVGYYNGACLRCGGAVSPQTRK